MDTETHDLSSDQRPASRRRVLIATSASVLGVASVATLSACGGGSDTASPGASSGGGLATPEPVHVEVVTLTDVPEGGSKAASVNGLNLLVTRPTADTAKIFTSVCPHMGCTVEPDGTKDLFCHCHSSAFSISDGTHLAGQGPAPYGLAEYPHAIENGVVYLTSTASQQPSDQ